MQPKAAPKQKFSFVDHSLCTQSPMIKQLIRRLKVLGYFSCSGIEYRYNVHVLAMAMALDILLLLHTPKSIMFVN
jgi:hypothetical protein